MTGYPYKVDMKGISKNFGGVKALQSVNFNVKSGEIHALVGENGAGKSTLMNILAGAVQKDEGEILIDGVKVDITSPKEGIANGISVIYQELALVGAMTVAENIFIDEYREGSKVINWLSLRKRAKGYLKRLGFEDQIDVDARTQDLSIAHQQVVEICKALARQSSVLVLDEPTSVLATSEVERLLQLLKELRDQGVAIIYISHRLDEIFKISDRITVLKDGKYVGTVDTSSIDQEQLVNMMIGRTLESYYPQRDEVKIGKTIMRVEGIRSGARVKDVSFEVREGEILGFSGLVGSGRTEAVKAIIGAADLDGGNIYIDGKKVNIRSPREAVKMGIGLLPEDRKTEGVILNLPIRNNITLGTLKNMSNALGWINNKKENSFLSKMIKQLDIKLRNVDDPVSSLSGGNQQKVSIAKMLALGCKVLILDEPTRGVDVGAKVEIFKIINDLVKQNYAVVMISSEMTEIIGMCDRVVVFREGRTVGELSKDEITEHNLINYAMGVAASGS